MGARFIVTEVEGRLSDRTVGVPGISCQVIDTKFNYRVMKTFRTEDVRGMSQEWRRKRVRELAHLHAERLNERDEYTRRLYRRFCKR